MYMFLLFFMISCAGTQHEEKFLVNDEAVNVIGEPTRLSSIFHVEKIVSLETADSCLLGSIGKIIKNGGRYYIKSNKSPLKMFSSEGLFKGDVGALGIGYGEYADVTDFDVDADNIYILESGRILVYDKAGRYERLMNLNLNASGLKVLGDKILLFVLGNDKVVYLLDKHGNSVGQTLDTNQALRLCKANSFIRYGDNCLLFPMGRSNDILMYKGEDETFERMQYFSSSKAVSIEEENRMLENAQSDRGKSSASGITFDGLSSIGSQIIFGSIEENDLTLWMRNLASEETKAYEFSSLVNDISFVGGGFFADNTVGEDCFLSYAMPYRVEAGLREHEKYSATQYYKDMKTILDRLDTEDANPIVIEYTLK